LRVLWGGKSTTEVMSTHMGAETNDDIQNAS
jgi:hypothetical protein